MRSTQQVITLTLLSALANAGAITVNNGCAGTIWYAVGSSNGVFGPNQPITAGTVTTVGQATGSNNVVALSKVSSP